MKLPHGLKVDHRMDADEALEVIMGAIIVLAALILGYHVWSGWEHISGILWGSKPVNGGWL